MVFAGKKFSDIEIRRDNDDNDDDDDDIHN